jgi:indole-3-glycerol phosphate synthase
VGGDIIQASLSESLRCHIEAGRLPIVAELKRVIPGIEGRPRDRRSAAALSRLYERGGAAAVSIVTESSYFGGAPRVDIPDVLNAVDLPIIIKDFIRSFESIDMYAELAESCSPSYLRRCSVLLIAHHVGRQALPGLIGRIRTHGMQPLVEFRGTDDLALLGDVPDLEVIGFNNKDIDVMETDEGVITLDRAFVDALRTRMPRALIISASGHRHPSHVAVSISAGADAVLIGTALLQANDPEQLLLRFNNSTLGPTP